MFPPDPSITHRRNGKVSVWDISAWGQESSQRAMALGPASDGAVLGLRRHLWPESAGTQPMICHPARGIHPDVFFYPFSSVLWLCCFVGLFLRLCRNPKGAARHSGDPGWEIWVWKIEIETSLRPSHCECWLHLHFPCWVSWQTTSTLKREDICRPEFWTRGAHVPGKVLRASWYLLAKGLL